MELVEIGGRLYIDQKFKDYLNNIFTSFNVEVPELSNLYFCKNVKFSRSVSDFAVKQVFRVIKKEKADFVAISEISITDYPQFWDKANNRITSDVQEDVLYGIYNNTPAERDTIKTVYDFYVNNIKVTYVNENYLNTSLNSGFIIDNDTYHTLESLINSNQPDNLILADSMIRNSDLEKNALWILYLYHKKSDRIKSESILNFLRNKFNVSNLNNYFNNTDFTLQVVKNDKDVLEKMIGIVQDNFNKQIQAYLSGTCNTNSFILEDFKLKFVK